MGQSKRSFGAALGLAAIVLTLTGLALADELDEARRVNEDAKRELEHTLPGDPKPALVPDTTTPSAAAGLTNDDDEDEAKPPLTASRIFEKPRCLHEGWFWYGKRCNDCPVGKLKRDGVCRCPRGFLDNGSHLSCRCPEGSSAIFGPQGPRCRGAGPSVTEGHAPANVPDATAELRGTPDVQHQKPAH